MRHTRAVSAKQNLPASAALLLFVFLLSGFSGLMRPERADAQPLRVGAFVSGQSVSSLSSFEELVGRKQDFYLIFASWDSNWGINVARDVAAHGTTPVITWEPWNRTLDGIVGGSYDSYIAAYASGLAQIPGTVYLRPMHEMNGNWYPWGYGQGNNSPAKYVAAFRHIVDIFRAQGATNVKFVWAPNNEGPPNWNADTIPSYYPGDDYVDFAAIDGYNWGTSHAWSTWKSFDTLFRNAYATVAETSSKPILIGEMASTETGGDKAAWIKETYAKIRESYPRIVGTIWFNVNKEQDWRVESSPASLSAYSEVLRSLDDTAAPSASLVSPASGSLVRGTVTMKASVDDTNLSKTVFLVDGAVKFTSGSTTAPSWSWNTKYAANGRHAVAVRSCDLAGNCTTSSTRWVTVDNTAPSVSFYSPTSSTLYRRYKGAWLKVSARDASGIRKVVYIVDGRVRKQDYYYSYTWYWYIRYVSTGRHKIRVVAYDKAGNTRSSTRYFYVK